MVKSVSNLTRSGLRDWLIQQLSAAFMAIYLFSLVTYLVLHPSLDFYSWHGLFVHNPVRITSFLFFLLLVWHAQIGIWTVITDYIKPTAIRLPVLLGVGITLFACLLWAIEILWGL